MLVDPSQRRETARQDFRENHLVARLFRWERERPDELAYRFLARGEEESVALSWAELALRTRRLAGELRRRTERGDRVLLLLEPGLDFVVAFLACLAAAVVAVPVPPPRPREGSRRLLGIAQSAGPSLVVTSQKLVSLLGNSALEPSSLGGIGVLTLAEPQGSGGPLSVLPDLQPSDLAFLQYTSGSTGQPKGVAVTHGNLLANERMIQKGFGQSRGSVVVGWLPLHHDMGLIGNVLQPVYLGATCVLMSPIDFVTRPIRWLRAISRYRGTTSGGPNFAYDLCVDRITPEELEGLDLSSWSVAFCGAEPVRGKSMQRFASTFVKAGFNPRALHPCYGMAECTLFAAGVVPSSGVQELWLDGPALEEHRVVMSEPGVSTARSFVGCGRGFGDQAIAIVDPSSHLPVLPEQVGEIWLSGAHVAAGYFRDPERTTKTFRAELANAAPLGHFLRSGDLGFMRDGQLFVTGRLTEMIIVRGRNYYAEDLEQSARNAEPEFHGATRTAAFACERDGVEGLVVLQELRRDRLGELTALRQHELESRIGAAIADEHGVQPTAIALVPPGAIPCTTSGKVRRRECRALYERGELPLAKPRART